MTGKWWKPRKLKIWHRKKKDTTHAPRPLSGFAPKGCRVHKRGGEKGILKQGNKRRGGGTWKIFQ